MIMKRLIAFHQVILAYGVLPLGFSPPNP